MKTLSELLREISSLPLGNIYKKKINGKTYNYHQYFYDGQRFSILIKDEDLSKLETDIEKRKQLEKEVKNIRSNQKYLELSNNAKELTGYVMSGNKIVATFEKGLLIDIDENLAPLVIKKTHSIEEFLKLRVIDMSRTNARILKRMLNIHIDEEYKSALYSYALSISDNYWFKPKHSKVTYENIEFKDDSYSDISLKGDITASIYKNQLTPEITTTGSFEKGWRYINKIWWLYKSGTKNQIFAELLSYEFALLMKIDTAIYEYDDGYIRSKNFANKYNFEPLAAILGNNDDYDVTFTVLYGISKNIAKQYLKLAMFDAVINNVDRHNENIGLMRNKTNGKNVSLAPNFDNNLAFYSNEEIKLSKPEKDGMIKLFINFLKRNEIAQKIFKEIDFEDINLEDIENSISRIPIQIENSSSLAGLLLDRYNYLKDYFN